MTQKFKILPSSTHDVGHAVGEARLAFDPTASSYFHMIKYVDVYKVWRFTHLKLQYISIRNLNGASILM